MVVLSLTTRQTRRSRQVGAGGTWLDLTCSLILQVGIGVVSIERALATYADGAVALVDTEVVFVDARRISGFDQIRLVFHS